MCTNTSKASEFGMSEVTESAPDDSDTSTITSLAVGMSVGMMAVVVLASVTVVLVIVLAVKLQKSKLSLRAIMATKDMGIKELAATEDRELNVANAVYMSLDPAEGVCDDTLAGDEVGITTPEEAGERLTEIALSTSPN